MTTFKQDILADLDDVFFDTDEFASAATFKGTTAINVIFTNAYRIVNDVESYGPQALCKTSDVSSAVHGNTLAVGGVTYYVIGIRPDAVGKTLLLLSRNQGAT